MSKRTIDLIEPIKSHRGMIKKIVLREPKYSDFIDLGMPATWVSLPNGGGFLQEEPAILGRWIERLCDVELTALELLPLRDVLAIRLAVVSFFTGAGPLPPTADADRSSAAAQTLK
jgi:hypothetical protein